MAFRTEPGLASSLSRAQPGLPQISLCTCDSLTSLPTEALLPNRAREVPRLSCVESTALSVQTTRLAHGHQGGASKASLLQGRSGKAFIWQNWES